jgi:lipoyl(octanoyl) transferase
MIRRLHGHWLGRRPYAEVHELQKQLHAARLAGEIGDTVLLLEHEPVVTLGRGSHEENVLFPKEILAERGVALEETGRGGDVTLHAPGQLVGYPIVALEPGRQDVRRYVGDLTETMRALARAHGIEGGTVEDLIGFWVDADQPGAWTGPAGARRLAKLGAIGVRISRWVTMHGFAFNLSTDLELFGLIVPCGISAHGVTSVQALTGARPDVREEAGRALEVLAARLERDPVALTDESSRPLSLSRLVAASPG